MHNRHFRRTGVVASAAVLVLASLTFGAMPAAAGDPPSPPVAPFEDHFDGGGLWQRTGPAQAFDPLDPQVTLSGGALALTTRGDSGILTHSERQTLSTTPDIEGPTASAAGEVSWSKAPVVPTSAAAWDVTLTMTLDASFPGTSGSLLEAHGTWTPTPVLARCTMSYPSACQVYAVGPLHLDSDGFYTSPGAGIQAAGVFGSTYCTSGSQIGDIHHPCEGDALPCLDGECQIYLHPPPECLPDEDGDNVCVERDGSSTCATGEQLTAAYDAGLHEQVCVVQHPMGACVHVVGGFGTLSGFYGASGFACASNSLPLSCWSVHVGHQAPTLCAPPQRLVSL